MKQRLERKEFNRKKNLTSFSLKNQPLNLSSAQETRNNRLKNWKINFRFGS